MMSPIEVVMSLHSCRLPSLIYDNTTIYYYAYTDCLYTIYTLYYFVLRVVQIMYYYYCLYIHDRRAVGFGAFPTHYFIFGIKKVTLGIILYIIVALYDIVVGPLDTQQEYFYCVVYRILFVSFSGPRACSRSVVDW